MPTPLAPSLLWGTYPSIPPAIDAPIQQDATFVNNPGAQRQYYQYLDSQIRAAETHIVQSLVGGLTGTIVRVDIQSPTIQIGQWVCLAGSLLSTVTLATLSALSAAGLPVGIALTTGVPGGICRIARGGIVPPSVTGLLLGSNLYAVVNTSTGFTTTVSSIGSNNYPVGAVDAAANLNVDIQFPPTSGGGGGLTVSGTGFWPVVAGVPGSAARAVNLASNGTNGDVTGILPFINGGHIQGDLEVTHASPGTFTSTQQIAYCDTSTGTCQVTFPPASAFPGSVIPADWQLLVVDTAGQAGANAITVNPNGETIWDPIGLAFGTSNVTLALNGIVVLWQWDIHKGHWVTGSSVFSKNPVPGATITGPYTVQVTDQWKLYDATAGTIAFLLPGPGNETGASVGLTREFTHIAGNGTGGIYATFNGNGANVQDPSSWPTLASVGEVRTIGITTRIRWDGSVYRCVN